MRDQVFDAPSESRRPPIISAGLAADVLAALAVRKSFAYALFEHRALDPREIQGMLEEAAIPHHGVESVGHDLEQHQRAARLIDRIGDGARSARRH